MIARIFSVALDGLRKAPGSSVVNRPARAVLYESRLHRWADLVAGLIWTPVDRWLCDSCGGVAYYLNRRQYTQWEELQQTEPGQRDGSPQGVECRALLRFGRICKGRIRPVEAVGK